MSQVTKNTAGSMEEKKGKQRNLVKDLGAALTVFFVALPLSIGVAVASGVDPAWGLFSAMVGGITAGIISGVPLQINGPSPGLIVICYEIVHMLGVEVLGFVVFLAGAVQMLAGKLRLAQVFRAISPSVILGMLTGIGLLIIFSQIHVMLDTKPAGTGIDNLLTIPGALWHMAQPGEKMSHKLAAMLGVLTIITLLLWQGVIRVSPQLKMLPATLFSVILVAFIANFFGLPVKFVDLPENIFNTLHWPEYTNWLGLLGRYDVLLSVLALVFISSAETLLVSMAITKMSKGARRPDYNKSLTSIGVGNLVSGILGVLPLSGIIVRSAVNVEAGATSKYSSLFLGMWLILFLLLLPLVFHLPQFLNWVPMSCLGAVLVYTGFKLIDISAIRELSSYGKSELVIFAVTVLAIVVKDLLFGIALGVVLAAIKILYIFTHLEIDVKEDYNNRVIHIDLIGSATFMRLPLLAETLEDLPEDAEVHIHVNKLDYIDHACLELMMNWEKEHVATQGKLIIDWEELFNTATSTTDQTPQKDKQ